MQVKVNTNDHIYKRELEISISAEEIEPLIKEEKKKLRRDADIPGFRKGKAPQNLIERRYGKILLQDVIDHTVNDFYPKALDEVKINPVKKGEISDLKYEKLGDDLSFKVETDVEPVVEVKDFSKMKFEKEVRHFRDEDLDEYFKYLLEDKAINNSIDGPAAENDFVSFDAEELDDKGRKIPGKSYTDIRIKLGHGQFDKEVEKDLVGAKVGETVNVDRTYPADFEDENLAGKTEHFKIQIKLIERQQLPELNDDFVKTLGNIETLDQYKDKITETMKNQYQRDAESSLLKSVTDQVIEANAFEVPPSMIDYELDLMYYNTQAQGQKMDEKVFRQYYREIAEKTVSWRIIKKALMKKENISASEDEKKKYLLNNGWQEANLDEALSNKYLLEQVEEEIIQKKVMELITGKAKVIEKDVTPKVEKKKSAATKTAPKKKAVSK